MVLAKTKTIFIALTFALAFGVGCASAPETAAEQSTLEMEAHATLHSMTDKDPQLQSVLDESAGYAVFPTVGEGALIAGVMSGVGVVYDRQGQAIGTAEVRGGSVGAQVGGHSYSQLTIFQTQAALDEFMSDETELSTDASATAASAGASARLSFEEGIAVVVDDETGLMAEASLDGQRYDYEPM